MSRRVDAGELTLVRYEFEPRANFPLHRHPEQQIVVIFRGSCRIRSGETARALKQGDVAFSPSMEPHGITAGEDGVVFLNIISPRRTRDRTEYLESMPTDE